MDLIDTFLERYRRTFERYERATQLCRQQCEVGLCSVRCYITARAKSFDSLRHKLRQRDARRSYQTVEEIEADIADLAGVRIALYFPNDLCKVAKFVRAHFAIEPNGVRSFPTAAYLQEGQSTPESKLSRLSGYGALHLRARSRPENLARADVELAEVRVEIQVASVLMHAWAEVEHDLVYKPRTHGVADSVRALLDEFNGIVRTGETALQRLQVSLGEGGTWSDPFEDQYELSAYLRATLPGLADADDSGDILMGPVDVLLRLLCLRGLDSPERLRACLADFHLGDESDPLPAAERIIVHLLLADPAAAADYVRARDYVNRPRGIVLCGDQQGEVARLLNRWFIFARASGLSARALFAPGSPPTPGAELARRYCDNILRCVEVPSAEELAVATQELEALLGAMLRHAS